MFQISQHSCAPESSERRRADMATSCSGAFVWTRFTIAQETRAMSIHARLIGAFEMLLLMLTGALTLTLLLAIIHSPIRNDTRGAGTVQVVFGPAERCA
jgi:hypothetical protein